MKKFIILLLINFSLLINISAQIYVNHAATGANDGTSWANAYTDLQTAIDASSAGAEIWVVAGTYYPTGEIDGANTGNADIRKNTFYISKNIKIYGGFIGNEMTLSERNSRTNITTLSGDVGTLNDNSDNAYHVVQFDGTTANSSITTAAILDGFTIEKGNANGAGSLSYGGGVYATATVSSTASSPTISNCIINNNDAAFGGGMFLNPLNSGTTNPQVINCIFSNNSATSQGGGVYSFGETNGTASPTFINCSFHSNQSTAEGSAIGFTGSSGTGNPTVINCTIAGNTSGGNATILNFGANCTAAFTNTIIFSNVGISIANQSSATATFNYGIYDDGASNNILALPASVTGANNTDNNPLFKDESNDDYTLLICSPAIDNGDNTSGSSINTQSTDVVGNARFFNSTTIDIGAYEFSRFRRTYVNASATGNNDGTSWADAYTDLQSALNSQCEDIEIWVAAGTYVPSNQFDTDGTVETRDKTFYISTDNMKIYGGFAGTETLVSQRNVAANPTIIDGNGNYHALVIVGGFGRGMSSNFVLDGFTIKNGNANGATTYSAQGGGLFIDAQNSFANPTINNCVFHDNSATEGGAIYFLGLNGTTQPTFTNCLFYNNTATTSGGAIFGYASNGHSNSSFVNCTFTNNTATTSGDAFYSSVLFTGSATLAATNCIFWSNGNTPFASQNANSGTINNCIFDDGTADGSVTLPSGYTGSNNQDQDPSFADAANNDFSLKQSSIAIDNGDATSGSSANTQTTDLAGNARFYNSSKIDVGAYEYQGVFALPVELIYFKGENQGATNLLTWQTASEQNNHGFEIQRAVGSGQFAVGSDLNWETIGFVVGNGTTTEVSDYEYTDDLNRVGFENRHGLYYRLKQIDFDGKFEYSNIVQLATGNSQQATVKLFPNPTTDILNIETTAPTTIQIFNTNGQIVKEQHIQSSQTISVKDLPSGIYYIKIGQNAQQLIIQR